jgi:ribonuclease VapC
MSEAVLDASALLAFLRKEKGAERVQEALGSARMSAVNLSEVIAKLAEYGKPVEEISYHIDLLQIPVVAFDAEQARMTASLREPTRAAGLSLGDRACLALALKQGLPALTTEKAWLECKVGVKVVKIR